MQTIIERRGYRRKPSASYIGAGLTSFDDMVKNGELPPGTVLTGSLKVWFKEDLDAFLDRKRDEQREVHHG